MSQIFVWIEYVRLRDWLRIAKVKCQGYGRWGHSCCVQVHYVGWRNHWAGRRRSGDDLHEGEVGHGGEPGYQLCWQDNDCCQNGEEAVYRKSACLKMILLFNVFCLSFKETKRKFLIHDWSLEASWYILSSSTTLMKLCTGTQLSNLSWNSPSLPCLLLFT